jgi:outer membrane lipoprotein LolB
MYTISNSPRVAARGAALLVCLLVTACAPVRVRETPAAAAAQAAREADLAPRAHWTLTARIAVSNGPDGGSGELTWQQDGERYTFTVQAPVTARTWKLSGDAQHAVLEGVDPEPDVGTDGQRLLHERLGWDVPLADLDAWVRGLRAKSAQASAPANVQYDERNLPAVIEQSGWKVEYRDWFTDRTPPLPRKVFASRGTSRVRMAIQSWNFDE